MLATLLLIHVRKINGCHLAQHEELMKPRQVFLDSYCCLGFIQSSCWARWQPSTELESWASKWLGVNARDRTVLLYRKDVLTEKFIKLAISHQFKGWRLLGWLTIDAEHLSNFGY